jgi:hypothetical protein
MYTCKKSATQDEFQNHLPPSNMQYVLEKFLNASILLCMIVLTSIVHPKFNMNCSQIIVGMKLNVDLRFMV